MAQDFKLNGTTASYLMKGDWQVEPGSQALSGQTPAQRWARLVLQAPEGMTAEDFDVLYALEGSKVSVDAPPYDDRNNSDYQTYYGADLESVRGEHRGLNVYNVVCELLVRL